MSHLQTVFQVRWDNSIPLFLHAAIYLEVSLFCWTSQNAFSRETAGTNDSVYNSVFNPFRDQRDICVPLTKSLFKSAGIRVSHFFSMLLSTLKYLCSVEPVRMYFPAKQPCTNDTVCNAAMQHCTQYHLYMGKCILTGSTEQRYFKVDSSMDKSGILLSQRTWKDSYEWDTYIPLVTKGLSSDEYKTHGKHYAIYPRR